MEQIHVFSLGCLIGLTLSYTGLSTFILGVFLGVIIQSSYPNMGTTILDITYSCSRMITAILITDKFKCDAHHKNEHDRKECEKESCREKVNTVMEDEQVSNFAVSNLTRRKIDDKMLDAFTKLHKNSKGVE